MAKYGAPRSPSGASAPREPPGKVASPAASQGLGSARLRPPPPRGVDTRRVLAQVDPKSGDAGAWRTVRGELHGCFLPRLFVFPLKTSHGISLLISGTINEVVSSTLTPVYLGVVPNSEHNFEADVATNFLAIGSSCLSLNALRRDNLFQKGTCRTVKYSDLKSSKHGKTLLHCLCSGQTLVLSFPGSDEKSTKINTGGIRTSIKSGKTTANKGKTPSSAF
ncbi:hypothetical protein AV530_010531 [Patagioenas fasciata monilis]|uniref:Uncharacterized protein n=1 Tax=Patagioenas fasciata monilis TaxID=372326 RepID=A0A1V4KF72_PATFA|nr:hypothetical protein AV530_010531 [Patagioenas fasciata monilis]